MSENKKYKLTDEFKVMDDGSKVFRIEATSSFTPRYLKSSEVKVGDLGGFVESEDNLSFKPDDDSWVRDDAVVKGNARLEGHSEINNNVIIKGDSLVTNRSELKGESIITDSIVDHSELWDTIAENSTFRESSARISFDTDNNNVIDSKVFKSRIMNCKITNSTFINSVAGIDNRFGPGKNIIENSEAVRSRIGIGNQINNTSIVDSGVGDYHTLDSEYLDSDIKDLGPGLSENDHIMIGWEADSWIDLPDTDEVGDQKYRLTDESIVHEGAVLYQIQAVQDIPHHSDNNIDVVRGQLGGYIESESNLNNEVDDQSWIYEGAIVKGESKVSEASSIRGKSVIEGDSVITEGDIIETHVKNSKVTNKSMTLCAKIYNSEVDNSRLYSNEIINERGYVGPAIYNSKIDKSNLENYTIVDNSSIKHSNVEMDSTIKDSDIVHTIIPKGSEINRVNRLDLTDDDLEGLSDLEDDLKL